MREQVVAPCAHRDDAALPVPPAAGTRQRADACGGLRRVEPAHERRRQALFAQQALGLVGREVCGEFEHPARAPVAALRRAAARERLPRDAEAGTLELRGAVVVAADMRMQNTPRQRRRALRGRACRIDDRDRPVATRQCSGGERTRESGADHERAALTRIRRRRLVTAHRPARRVAAAQHVALAAEARQQLELEARGLECVAHAARRAPARERGAGQRESRRRTQQRGRPHLRIALGREAVEIERIDAGDELRHERRRIAQSERQDDAFIVEGEPMQAADRLGPLRNQRREQSCSACGTARSRSPAASGWRSTAT